MSGNRQAGTVKWFNDQKGFGFIVPEADGPDVFVHHTDIDMEGFRSLADGDRVEFGIEEGVRGPKATGVRVIDEAEDEEGEPVPRGIHQLTTIDLQRLAKRAAEIAREHDEMPVSAVADQAVHERIAR